MADKIPLNRVLNALDQKQYDFYRNLSEQERKQIAPFVLNRFMSLVKGDRDVQAYYLMSANEHSNKHFFDYRDAEIQWMRLCTISPGIGKQFHQWVGLKKDKSSNNKLVKFLLEKYPERKQEDVELWASKMDKKDIKELLAGFGLTEKDL